MQTMSWPGRDAATEGDDINIGYQEQTLMSLKLECRNEKAL